MFGEILMIVCQTGKTLHHDGRLCELMTGHSRDYEENIIEAENIQKVSISFT